VAARGKAHAATMADLDNDGDLDIAMNLGDSIVIALNQTPRPKDRRPLTVSLQARTGRIGAVLRVLDERRRILGLRELNGAEGCGGQASPIAHMFVPQGKCTIYAALSDGRLATRTITVDAKASHVKVAFKDSDFH